MNDGTKFEICECLHCGQHMEYPVQERGTKIKCPGCQQEIVLLRLKSPITFSKKLLVLASVAGVGAALLLGFGFGCNRPGAAEKELRAKARLEAAQWEASQDKTDPNPAFLADASSANKLENARDILFSPFLALGWFALIIAPLLLIASWLAKSPHFFHAGKILRNRWFFAAASMAVFFAGTLAYIAINANHPVSLSDPLFWGFGLLGSFYGPIYMLPTIIGLHKHNALAIFLLNVFLGWTGIGWVAALIWSVLKLKPSEQH